MLLSSTIELDRQGNKWDRELWCDSQSEFIAYSSRLGLYDGTYWFLKGVSSADEALDVLIRDGKVTI
jgi:hypothetical protein